MSEEELKILLQTYGKVTPLWKRAFDIYNKHNAKKLSMSCKPCYAKVYSYLKTTNN